MSNHLIKILSFVFLFSVSFSSFLISSVFSSWLYVILSSAIFSPFNNTSILDGAVSSSVGTFILIFSFSLGNLFIYL